MSDTDGAPVASVRWLDAAHLARGVALAAAVAASVFGAELIGSLPAAAGALLAVCLLAGSAALVTLQDRLPAPRSVRAWVLWSIGGVVFLLLAIAGLLGAAAALTAQHGAATALAAAVAWLLSIGLNQLEARRAFRVAGVLQRVRQVLAGLSALWVLALASLLLVDRAGAWAGAALQRTAFEALAPGLGWLVGGLFALILGASIWQLPRWLARWQLQGRIAASAAGEATWFAALAPLAIPLALPDAVFGLAAVSSPVWGQTALRVLAVVLAHGVARVWLGGAGSAAPVPLLVLVRDGQASPRLRDWLERLPLAWRGGPVIRVMPPRAALAHAGAHLRLAARVGDDGVLFPVTSQDMCAWRAAVPPARRWRALAAQELYAEPLRWAECLRTLVDAQTWVLWVDAAGAALGSDTPAQRSPLPAAAWAEALPAGRAVRLVFDAPSGDNALEPGEGQTLWRSMPGWVDGLGPPFPQWLRARLQPPAPRSIVVLHAPADAALARAIVAALDSQHDTEGHAVQAWALSDTGQALWLMPVAGFRLLARVQLDALDRPSAANAIGTAAVNPSLGTRLLRLGAALYGVKTDQPAPAYELVMLQAAHPHAQDVSPRSLSSVVFRQASQRIGLRRDAMSESPVGLDAQVIAPPAAASLDDRAAWFAQRLLRHEWIGLAVATPIAQPQPLSPESDIALKAVASPGIAASAASAASNASITPMVFISAPSGESSRSVAVELAQRLKAMVAIEGFEVFAADLVLPGVNIFASANEAMARCTHFVPLVCNEFWTRSKACRQELFSAVARFEETGRPLLLPVLLGAVDPELLDFDIPRQMGELRSANPKLASVNDLQFIGPFDDSGHLQALDALPGAHRSAQIEQVLERLVRSVGAEPAESRAEAVAAQAGAAPPTPEAPADGFLNARGLGEGVSSLVVFDTTWLAAGLLDGRIAIWQPGDTESPQHLDTGGGKVWCLCSQSGILVSANHRGTVTHWTGSPPHMQPKLLGQHECPVRALRIMHDEGNVWAVAGDDQGVISWWPINPGLEPRHQTGLGAAVESLDGDGDRCFVALGPAGLTVVHRGQPVRPPTVEPTTRDVHVVAQSWGGDELFSGGSWNGRGYVERRKIAQYGLDGRDLTGLPSQVTAIQELSGDRLAIGFADGGVAVWSPSVGANALETAPRHQGPVRAVLEWPDGRLCSAGDDGDVIIGAIGTPKPAA